MAWGFDCTKCSTRARFDTHRFDEFIKVFELAIDVHNKLAPLCRPSSEQIVFIDWLRNPDWLPGPYYRVVEGRWRELTSRGQIK